MIYGESCCLGGWGGGDFFLYIYDICVLAGGI